MAGAAVFKTLAEILSIPVALEVDNFLNRLYTNVTLTGLNEKPLPVCGVIKSRKLTLLSLGIVSASFGPTLLK